MSLGLVYGHFLGAIIQLHVGAERVISITDGKNHSLYSHIVHSLSPLYNQFKVEIGVSLFLKNSFSFS